MYKKIKFAEVVKDWINLDISHNNVMQEIDSIGIEGLSFKSNKRNALSFIDPLTSRELMSIHRGLFHGGQFSIQVEGNHVYYGAMPDDIAIKFIQAVTVNPSVANYLIIELLFDGVVMFDTLVSRSVVSPFLDNAYKEHKTEYDHKDKLMAEMEIDLSFLNGRMLKYSGGFKSDHAWTSWKLLDFNRDREGSLTVHESREPYNALIGAMFLAGID